MTVFAIAMVDTDGEIFHFYHPAATLDPEGACKLERQTQLEYT